VTPLVDIGANLTNRAFASDVDLVIARAFAAGVGGIVVTGTAVDASAAAASIAAKRPGRTWATAGMHPHHAKDFGDETIAGLRALAEQPHVVAVGECGLDYDRDYSPRPDQRRAFAAQVELACALDMPLFLHEREAHDDFVAVLREHRAAFPRAVVHCFTGDAAALAAYVALDLHIGITGWICDDRRGLHLRELVRTIPPDRLMLETDSPYLLPRDLPTKPRNRRNEPGFLPHVLRTVAAGVGRDPEQVAAETTATAIAFFGLQPAW
jgi:TatD DNase family protein